MFLDVLFHYQYFFLLQVHNMSCENCMVDRWLPKKGLNAVKKSKAV